jgi:hypothetical protein
MANKTLLDLRTESRQRSNQENSTFVTDTELNAYINASAAELYDLLVGKFEDYFTVSEDFSISSGNTWTLPSNFYKLRGLDFDANGTFQVIRPFTFAERMSTQSRSYRVVGDDLIIMPETSAPGNYRLWWIPRMTQMSADTDQLRGVMDFDEYVIVDAAMKCLLKEESDISALMAMKEGLKQRINSMAANRDASGEANAVADVTGGAWDDDNYAWWQS